MQNLAPIISVDLPEYFVHNENFDLEIIYQRPSTCHTFSGLNIEENPYNVNERTIGVVTNYRTNNTNCVNSGNLQASATINFVAEREDFYIFKFWQGRNAVGNDEFLIVEVPVTQPGIE